MSPDKADAAAQVYITARTTEPNTTVGQQPKVVVTYGNIGNTRVSDYSVACFFNPNFLSSPTVIFTSQNLIPGQNANRETTFRAITAGTTTVTCQITGVEAGTNQPFSVNSAPVTINIKPQ